MSNSLAPYVCKRIENEGQISYIFTTDGGVIYTAYFIDCENYSAKWKDENIFMFNFGPEGNKPPKNDPRIERTIIWILKKFFLSQENSAIYVCDSTDGLELSRARLFERWFRRAEMNEIKRTNLKVSGQNYDLIASLFIHQNNPNIDEIRKGFFEFADLVS